MRTPGIRCGMGSINPTTNTRRSREPVQAEGGWMTQRRHPLAHMAALMAAASLLVVSLAGCTSSDAEPASGVPSGGMMGGAEGAEMKMGSFVIAAPQNARIDVAKDGEANAEADTLTVKRVVAPVDGWIVVRSTAATGGVLGTAPVKRGESRNVAVKVANPDSHDVRVALHIDGGTRGTFEFDSTGVRLASDRPVFASGVPVEEAVVADVFGLIPVFNSALIKVDDQVLKGSALTVTYLLVPAQSWVSVNLVQDDGLPGAQVGLTNRPAGEWQQVTVPLTQAVTGEDLVVTVFADQGTQSRFEYDPQCPFSSLDRQYVSAGVTVAQRISVK